MVRTLADGGSKKAVASKAPRKQLGGGSGGGSSSMYSSSSSSNNPNFGLCNHAKMWPTPSWQKGINNFFKKCDKPVEEESAMCSDRSVESCEPMDSNDEIVVLSPASCSGSSSNDGPCASSSSTNRIYSDEEDKENIDPSSSPEHLAPKVDSRRSDRSDSASPSPKMRQKKSGKQKAGPCKKKKRMVLEEDSDYDE